jgi:glucosylceramidase
MYVNLYLFVLNYSFVSAVLLSVAAGGVYGQMQNPANQTAFGNKEMAEVYVTAQKTGERLAKRPDVAFENRDNISPTITFDPSAKFQEIVGFGGAFTEAAAYALSKVSLEKRAEVIKAYFDPTDGLGYSLCRTHINSCDFSLGNYDYNAVAGDTELKNFSIERDKKLLIPLIRDAKAAAGDKITIFASPWSPPAWMKTNGMMNWGGKLKQKYAGVWAKYFAKYIKAYAKEGIDIWGVTVQNEPAAVQMWDSCEYSAQEERDFVKNHLGPTLASENLGNVKIIIFDHNKNIIVERADGVLSDSEAAKYVWGVGYHWYRGEHFDKLDQLNGKYPDKKLLFTEGCIMHGPRIGAWDTGEQYGHNIIGDLNHYAVGWVDWNIAIDEHGGPNHARNFCDAPVIANGKTNSIIYESSFYYLGHFSKFIRPGAVRIGCQVSDPALEATAFRNTAGRIAVVVMNQSGKAIDFSLGQGARLAKLSSPAHSIQTVVFAN